MFERFTTRARAVVVSAREAATTTGERSVRPEHLLLGVLDDPDCLAVRVLDTLGAGPDQVREALGHQRQSRPPQPRRGPSDQGPGLDEDDVTALRAIGIDLDQVIRRVEENLGGGLGALGAGDVASPGRRWGKGRVSFAADSKKVLELAVREALALGHNYIGTEHLLLGLLRVNRGPVDGAFTELGLHHRAVRAAVVEALRKTG